MFRQGPDSDPQGQLGRAPGVRQLSLLAAIIAIAACWPIVRAGIPIDDRFAIADLIHEHWSHRSHLDPWLDQRWAWLAFRHYHFWFGLAALPGALAIGIVQSLGARSIRPLGAAPLGWAIGFGIGYLLFLNLAAESWPAAVMIPATFSFLGGAVAARLSAPSPNIRHLRGARVRQFRFGRIKRIVGRVRGQVTLAGVPLSLVDETMHIAAIGSTGSGKSTALRELMTGAVRRGDRHVVADPEGTAMSMFWSEGDVILNPFDRRSAKWDILSEIERPSDYAFIGQSLLPHLGSGEHDQWITYAQQLLAGVMENFVRLELGSSDDLTSMLASSKIVELKELCHGTPAARYFEEGGERMLASILGTLAPAIANLRSISAIEGQPFSVRTWMRSSSGTLWMPYAAKQVAAVRALISCWMNIAILEALSFQPSQDRRIWFHIDELDALGRIEGLKDGLARLRKFGGRFAIGFQSFSQVKEVYGEGAHTIIENCGNLLLLRSGTSAGGGTAKLGSDLIGEREIERHEASRSETRNKTTSRSSSESTRRHFEHAIIPSQLTALSVGEGLVQRAGKAEWLRVRVKH